MLSASAIVVIVVLLVAGIILLGMLVVLPIVRSVNEAERADRPDRLNVAEQRVIALEAELQELRDRLNAHAILLDAPDRASSDQESAVRTRL